MPLIQNRIFRRIMWCAAAVLVGVAIIYPTIPSRKTVARLTAEIKARHIHRLIEAYAQKNGHYPEGLAHVDDADATWRVALSRFASRDAFWARGLGDDYDGKTTPEDFILFRSSQQTPFYYIRASDSQPDTPPHYITDQNGLPVLAAIPSFLSEWTSTPDISMTEILERSQRGEPVYLSYPDWRFYQVNVKKHSIR